MSSSESSTPHPVASAAGFFDAWWSALAVRGWEAVVLHSWRDLPERIGSDIDYAVRGPEPLDLLRFLALHAKEHGWRLVQAIEHEPGAWFCVCQQAAPPFVAMQLDVTWSYRRLGHVLVSAEVLFEGHREVPGKSFRVPSPGSEFAYLLAKTAAKGKEFGKVRGRLAALLDEDSEGCRAMAMKAFGELPPTGGSLGDWEAWFAGAAAFAPVRRGRRLGIGETMRYLRRMRHPTGMRLKVGMEADEPAVRRVGAMLEPSFRAVLTGGRRGFKGWLRLPLQLIRTRLVIEARAAGDPETADAAVARAIGILSARIEARLGLASGRREG